MLRQVQADFAHAARVSMLGELTASIAHEVNQPLAAIATNAAAGLRWLDRAEPDIAEVRALTRRIIADAQRAADIIARIRTMADHKTPEPTSLSMNSAIEESMLFLAHELQAHSVMLKLDLGRNLPLVLADRTQLQQVIVNLVVNAIQAMAQTPASARTLVISTAQMSDAIVTSVTDSGSGIDPSSEARLFESFFSTKSNGMGMGLPICRSILSSRHRLFDGGSHDQDHYVDPRRLAQFQELGTLEGALRGQGLYRDRAGLARR
jgi:C4-dicarboxylate-specific signal transduction histidine kinase